MELGIYHEFPVLPGRSQAECFAAGFDIVDASEEYGLDVMPVLPPCGMAVASGPDGGGQVTTTLRRSRTLGLPVPTQAKRRIPARQSRSTADGDTGWVCKRAICRCTNRSRQQPWRPRRWESGARRIRPAGEGPIQWN